MLLGVDAEIAELVLGREDHRFGAPDLQPARGGPEAVLAAAREMEAEGVGVELEKERALA